ncbi:MAG: flagellar filament capping protein FliD [Brevinema sp.]
MKSFILFILLFVPIISNAQRVRLSGIPGQDSDMDITKMLDQIMVPYYNEVTNLNNKRLDQEIEFELWQEFRSNIQNFEQVNRYILGYESSFRSVTNYTSDPSALSIQTTRQAKPGDYRLSINTLADAHAFSTSPIPLDKILNSGDFSVIVNSNTNYISFQESTIDNLYSTLNSSLSNIIDVKLLNASATEKIIALVSKNEGASNRIKFDGDIAPLLDANFLSRGQEQKTNFSWYNNSNTILTNTNIAMDLSYPISMPTVLSFSSLLEEIPIITNEEPSPKIALSNLNTEELGSISNFNIILPGAKPILDDVPTLSNVDSLVEDLLPVQQLILVFNDNTQEIIDLDSKKYSVSLDQYIDKNLIQIKAISEQKILTLSDLEFIASPNGSLVLHNETVKGQDASFLLDGVEFTRPSNTIADLIPGVTLNLQQDQKTNILVQIKMDIELIKDTIIQWVINYNTLMEELHTFTTIPINQIGRLKPLHQRKKDGDNIKEGTFYGNITLINFKNRMKQMVSSPYNTPTSVITLLDQVGIYVRRRTAPNNDPDAIRKGTLTLDVSELEKSLNQNFSEVQNLFAMDTDGNAVGDKGVVVASIDSLQIMIGNDGYLTRMDQNNSRKLNDLNTQIIKKENEIERVSQKERQALLQMNQAIMQSKSLSESLQQRFNY